MSKILENCSLYAYKIIAFIIFWIGVFTINSACNVIFHQPEESEKLKRFCKK